MLGTQDILMLGPKDGGWKKGVRALGAQASPGRGRKKRDRVPVLVIKLEHLVQP